VNYVFAEKANINDVIRHQKDQLRRVVDGLEPAELLRRPVDDVVGDVLEWLRLDVPVLDRNGIVQLPPEEVDIDVSHDPMRAIIPGHGPYVVKGTEVSILIPFSAGILMVPSMADRRPSPFDDGHGQPALQLQPRPRDGQPRVQRSRPNGSGQSSCRDASAVFRPERRLT
jgi:hypothetical protein